MYIVCLCISKLKFETKMTSAIEKWAKDMNRWKPEKNLQMFLKHMKRCSAHS